MENLGTCPICGKGKIIEGTGRYNCVNVAAGNVNITEKDVCTFSFYKSYFSHELTFEEVKKLITDGQTDEIKDLKRKDGTTFSAKLMLDRENKLIKPLFSEKQAERLSEKCPVCGGSVLCTTNYFICENAIGDEKTCFFVIQKTVAQKELTKKMIETLIKNGKTDFISGFTNSRNEEFETQLVLEINKDEKRTNVTFNSNICACPKCKSGIIVAGTKAYGCTNYKNEDIKCNFTVWKDISGRTLSIDEVRELCEKGQTEILNGFKTKDGKKYEGKLILVDDFKTKII